MYLENCNSHTSKSIHRPKQISIQGDLEVIQGDKIPDKNVCQLNKADYLFAIESWM